jgi:serine protease
MPIQKGELRMKKLIQTLVAIVTFAYLPVASAVEVTSGFSGSWYDKSHDGEGYILQIMEDKQAVVLWFTYDPDGNQFWLLGLGNLAGSKITFDSMLEFKGGKFGPDFDPADVTTTIWGSLEFDFNSCSEGTATYHGPGSFGSGSLNIEKLTSVWGLDCEGNQQPVTKNGEGLLKPGFSGSWFDPEHDGEGFTVEVMNPETAIVFWFTYDAEGNSAWMLSLADIEGSHLFANNILQPSGAKFGPGFKPSDVSYAEWGQAVFTFGSCSNGGMRYIGPDSYGPESTQVIQRISEIEGAECGFFGGTYRANGDMKVALNTYIDGDTNDALTPLIANNNDDGYQNIFTPAYVAGFVTENATGEKGQRFENEADQGDLYRIGLREGERVSLHIASDDSSQGGGDLDLYLYDANQTEQPIDSSLGTGNEEMVYAPKTGDYFLWVWAQQGQSNYTLRTGWDISSATSSLTLNIDMAADQVLVRHIVPENSPHPTVLGPDKYLLNDLPAGVALNRLSTVPNGTNLYALESGNINFASNLQFPLKNKGFGISDHRKWAVVLASKELQRVMGVAEAGPNYIAHQQSEPNDLYYPNQWHYKAIGLENAWDVTRGSDDVVVAVIDSGVAPHPDLVDNIDYALGYDFVRNSFLSPSGDNDGIDPNAIDPGAGYSNKGYTSHGTHVAGTVGAMSNNSEGLAGVNWNVTIMPIRAGSPDGRLYCDAILDSLNWAGRLPNSSGQIPAKQADVINMSFRGFGQCAGRQSILNQLYSKGIVLVAASGNDSTSRPAYPASLPGVISVSATNRGDSLAAYSNFGSTVDVAAPGGEMSRSTYDGIWSTSAENPPFSSSYFAGYQSLQGTSMASPHVAGVAALMKSVYPNMTANDFDYALSSGEITDDLARNGVKNKDSQFGYGRINAQKAVSWALEASNPGERDTFITSSGSALDFGSSSTGLYVDVGKSGPADLTFALWYREHDWISLEAIDTNSRALGTYRVLVDRSGLPRGQYRSTIWFEAENKSYVRISISVQVGDSVPGEAGQLWGNLLDAYSLTSQYWWGGLQKSDSFDVRFNSVAPGYYYLLVGSDMDGDGYFCDEGEFCRIYPSDSEPQLIEVVEGNLTLSNFTMTIPSPRNSASQASAMLADEDGSVEQVAEAIEDFEKRFGQSGWRIKR